jgi:large subunit ribosomal protein L27
MATSKSGGSTGNGRESHSKRLGCKCFDGELVGCGDILVRQRGTRLHPGKNVKRGSDDTLFSIINGTVKYHSGLHGKRFVSVFPANAQ